ncbi:hypothetical protein ACHAPT_000704 [Fusarium lateritium]
MSTNLVACLLAAIAYAPTDAKPIAIQEEAWNEEGTDLFKLLASEGSKFLQELADKTDDASHTARSDDDSNKTRAAIIGGTITAGIILGMAIFLIVLAYKRYIAVRRLGSKEQAKSTSSQRDSMPETTTDNPHRNTWRDTFNHRISIPEPDADADAESVRSERSFRTMSTDAQVWSFPPGQWPLVSKNDSEALDACQGSGLVPSIAASPFAPKPLRKMSPFKGPLVTEKPSTTSEQQITEPPSATSETTTRHLQRKSGSPSIHTMSTPDVKLPQDTKQPPAPAKYSLFPKCEPRTDTIRPMRVRQPSPAAMDNRKKPKRMSSRKYFRPLFKNNGQLQSPTSPGGSIGIETVMKDESRVNRFSMGENKI